MKYFLFISVPVAYFLSLISLSDLVFYTSSNGISSFSEEWFRYFRNPVFLNLEPGTLHPIFLLSSFVAKILTLELYVAFHVAFFTAIFINYVRFPFKNLASYLTVLLVGMIAGVHWLFVPALHLILHAGNRNLGLFKHLLLACGSSFAFLPSAFLGLIFNRKIWLQKENKKWYKHPIFVQILLQAFFAFFFMILFFAAKPELIPDVSVLTVYWQRPTAFFSQWWSFTGPGLQTCTLAILLFCTVLLSSAKHRKRLQWILLPSQGMLILGVLFSALQSILPVLFLLPTLRVTSRKILTQIISILTVSILIIFTAISMFQPVEKLADQHVVLPSLDHKGHDLLEKIPWAANLSTITRIDLPAVPELYPVLQSVIEESTGHSRNSLVNYLDADRSLFEKNLIKILNIRESVLFILPESATPDYKMPYSYFEQVYLMRKMLGRESKLIRL